MALFLPARRVLLSIISPLLTAVCVTALFRTTINAGSLQCRVLSYALHEKVSYPASAAYLNSSSSYWSKQEESLAPSCIVTPTSTEDVVTVIRTLKLLNKGGYLKGNLAIRGGGHTPWAGSANINEGVTIDMRSVNEVKVDEKKTVASVGAGAIWGSVYQKMDSLGLAVVGGRGSTIGVGGLVTGGGISYFSARKGFACDNVVNFQVVLASGQVVNANANENSDLWGALKGGSNNFGVVTRFDLRAFPQGNFWGGMILYDDSTSPQLLKAFANLNKAIDFDEYAALILSFSYVSSFGFIVSANMEYTRPVTNPPTFRPFTSIQPQFSSTMRISNQTDFTTEFVQSQPNGRRQKYITNTFKNDLSFLNSVYKMFKKIGPRFSAVPGFILTLTVQPIPPATTSKAAPLGGNSLGLDPSDGALVLCLISATWDTAADDAEIASAAKSLNSQIVNAAKAKGLFHDYVYLNYADDFQDPIGGYGAANKARLRAVSRKYDPNQVFQKNVPGGFKLFP